jgi:alpha-ketoglutarate-dependent taurine dioxygenase
MLQSAVTDPRAWRAATVDEPRCWYYPLSERSLEAVAEAVRQPGDETQPITELRAPEGLWTRCANDLRPALGALEAGRGFAILVVPPERFAPRELQAAYWLVGQLLGRPVAQNVQGTLLYDVRDEGQDVRAGARFSVTRAETGFHTDNSFGDEVVDYVGLLCLHPARSGGLSQVVSGYTVYGELRARHADVLAALERPFHIDRRGGLRPGDAPTAAFPVLHRDGPELLCRYLRYWIEAGQEKAGQPLTETQRRALDILDGVLGEPELRVTFALRPGDLFFVNNRWVLHNRSAFEDHAEPERRRHCVRLWLQRK